MIEDTESTAGLQDRETSHADAGENGDSDQETLVDSKPDSSKPTSKATGPRTSKGKEKTKHNALKHGIFCSVALLKSESPSEFNSLLNGLHDSLQPEGALEEILVEKLAVLSWRYRRLIVAEKAEIQRGARFVEWDEAERQQKEALGTRHDSFLDFGAEVVGLMHLRQNPLVLGRCFELLDELKKDIETNGFNSEPDEEILTKLYGNSDHWTETLFDAYRLWCRTAESSDEEREQNGYASVEQCKTNVLEELKSQIRYLNQYKKAKASVESEKLKLEALRRNVPDSPQLDRLLKYEGNLERAFDRTLTQLERLQRMRLGHPVAPPITVSVSSS